MVPGPVRPTDENEDDEAVESQNSGSAADEIGNPVPTDEPTLSPNENDSELAPDVVTPDAVTTPATSNADRNDHPSVPTSEDFEIDETKNKIADTSADGLIETGTALSVPNPPRLGALQRTNTNVWTPATQEKFRNNWNNVSTSEVDEASGPSQFERGQNFSRVLSDDADLPNELLIDESMVTKETAEAMFLQGHITEACRQYLVLIERAESSLLPDVPQLVNWCEALTDLYILLDDLESAVSFYHKTRVLTSEREPRLTQKYISGLLKLSRRYDEHGQYADAERTCRTAILIAEKELDDDDILHHRIDEAYVQHTKCKTENSAGPDAAAIEEQCTTLRMRALTSSPS
ncbi:MAG: hypothetical protein SGJ27_17565 [Candidatus Melainabacteria bacterium]|nr:hypothetical protein [Candidatus Melainabacteria bacterium]